MSDVTSRAPRTVSRPPLSGRWILLLVALAVAPYLNALQNDFVYDDHALITENDLVQSLDPRHFVQPSLDRYVVEWYRPVTMFSLALNYRVGGTSPLGYHLANVLLHAVNVGLLYGIACHVLRRSIPALIATGLFAVHAIHVEAVTPVSGRADLLATAFVLLAWRLALPASRAIHWPRALAIGAAALAGLLAKESAIVVWPLIALSDVCGFGAQPQQACLASRLTNRRHVHAALAVALVAALGLRYVSTGELVAASEIPIRSIENPLVAVDTFSRVVTALWVLGKYVFLLIAPIGLSADYSLNQIPVIQSWHDPRLAIVAGLVIGSVATLVRARRRLPDAVALTGLFLLLWLPVSNLVVVIGTIMAERLMYLPSVAAALLLGALLSTYVHPMRPAVGVVLAAVAAIHVGLTLDRNRVWRSEETLFRDTVEQSPQSAKAHFNYGIVLNARGETGSAGDHFRAAIRIAPGYTEATNALGTVLLAQHDLEGAAEQFRQALRSDPHLSKAWLNLGTTYFRAGDDANARRSLDRALELDPTLVIAHATLGAIAERHDELPRAIDHYWKAFALAPEFEGLAPHLADLLAGSGRAADAALVRRQMQERRSSAPSSPRQ